jgi:CzcA family heavy metal efflux pump
MQSSTPKTLSTFVWHHRKAALLLVAALCVMGAFFSQHLPVAIFPDLTAPRIIITADSGDLPIPTMVANVTRPLENAVAGVPGITRIGSLTQRGNDELDVNFAWGTDMIVALQKVEAKLSQIQSSLPTGTNVQAEQLNPSVFPIMEYNLYSSNLSGRQLRDAALYTLRPRLLRVPGVQQINVLGGDTPNYTVDVDPAAMLAHGVTIQNVQDALSKTNQIASVGFYDKSYLHNEVMVSGLLKNQSDIANVTVSVKNRVPVTIAEIATIRPGIETHTVETSGDGHPAVLIDVIKQPSGNTIQIADGIKTVLAQMKSQLPAGVTISNSYDQSLIVRESQSSVLEAIIIGGILALFVLMLFLGNLRTAAVVLIILPLTILITFALMNLLGQTMNIMTLGALAIALGLVIDDGIVVVENMFHELESGKTRRAAITAGLRAITPAMVGSSLTTMAAFLPLTMLSGLTGQFFGPLALVMVATLAVSLILALLLTPILADYLLPLKVETPHGRIARILRFFPSLFDHVVRVYTRILRWCLRRYAFVLVLLIPIAFAGWLLYSHVQTGFFPEFDEGGFVLDYQLPFGTSLAESSAQAGKIEQVLADTPEVAAWSRRTGAQNGFDITSQDQGDISVRLKENRTHGIDEIMDDVRTRVQSQVPAADCDFHQILQDEIGDIAGSPSPVQVKIFGDDSATLEKLADQVNDLIAKVPGVVDNKSGIVLSSPETMVAVDTERAQRYGLTADDVRQGAQAAIQGVEPTTIQQGEQQVGVRVLARRPTSDLDSQTLANIPIASPVTNGTVPLGVLTNITKDAGALNITRENQRQMVAVTAGLSGRDLGSATHDIQQRIAKEVSLPTGYSIEYGGLYESQQQSFADLAVVLMTAIALVFILLVIQLRSFGQSIALLLAAILSLVGVLLGLFITKTPLNISSMTGAVMIVGIVTENGIVLFEFFNALLKQKPNATLVDLMEEAGAKRLRPILMTTIGAILALFPLALGIGAGAALQKPLAIAVIGGLTVSTLFTLIIAPVLFAATQSFKGPVTQKIAAHEEDFSEIERELSEELS